jgi:hypothetical protein
LEQGLTAERDEASKGASSIALFHPASGMPASFGSHSAVDFRWILYLLFIYIFFFLFAQLFFYHFVLIQK